jgi:hypothetical protein
MKSAARVGGLSATARRDNDRHASLMRRAYRTSFLGGHACRLCPRVDIPSAVADRDRRKRADALWQLHWIRMRGARRPARTRRRVASLA